MSHISGARGRGRGGALHKDQEALRTQELIIKISILLVIAYAILIPLQPKFINKFVEFRVARGSIEFLVVFIHPGATVSASCLLRHSLFQAFR